MVDYVKSVEIRWSDLDPNFHVRHSVYYDLGAYVRVCFLTEHGLSAEVLAGNHIGPVLFREECIFRREIRFGDTISVNLVLKQCLKDYSRWTMQHEIIKNGDVLSAIITVDGAWIDTQKRKLATPFDLAAPAFDQVPKSGDFKWLENKI